MRACRTRRAAAPATALGGPRRRIVHTADDEEPSALTGVNRHGDFDASILNHVGLDAFCDRVTAACGLKFNRLGRKIIDVDESSNQRRIGPFNDRAALSRLIAGQGGCVRMKRETNHADGLIEFLAVIFDVELRRAERRFGRDLQDGLTRRFRHHIVLRVADGSTRVAGDAVKQSGPRNAQLIASHREVRHARR